MADSRVKETHVSWVFFVADRVYKVKKPVVFPFLDWTTPEAREEACRSEVRLNRRLSPDVYLGVGHFTAPDGGREPVVVMRRLPADCSLSALIRRGDPSLPGRMEELAAILAAFHAQAERGPAVDRDCTPEAVSDLWRRNLVELEGNPGCRLPPAVLSEVAELADGWLRGREPLLESRVADGRAVDGHGDLLCDDTFFPPDGVRVLDCLEFDPALRHGDTVADLAALAMDIEHLGRPELAGELIRSYQAASGDRWPPSLTDFWISYRALVRAKVGCYRCSTAAGREARAIRDDVGRLVGLAVQHLRSARIRVVLVGGLPGTGKTTLARRLGEHTGWPVLSSDALRRATAGPGPGVRTGSGYGQGIYARPCIDANYQALIRSAAERVRHGYPVILDASWSRSAWRGAAGSMARERSAQLVALECVAPVDVARGRILARKAAGDNLSDATPEVAVEMAGSYDPWPEAVKVDTSCPQADSLDRALSALD
ncbi:MAG TPA: AAA family ATPase [Acidimicrobiales bacterium]|nr:AAA family ATPase [Acidimicrobiales bacterium]